MLDDLAGGTSMENERSRVWRPSVAALVMVAAGVVWTPDAQAQTPGATYYGAQMTNASKGDVIVHTPSSLVAGLLQALNMAKYSHLGLALGPNNFVANTSFLDEDITAVVTHVIAPGTGIIDKIEIMWKRYGPFFVVGGLACFIGGIFGNPCTLNYGDVYIAPEVLFRETPGASNFPASGVRSVFQYYHYTKYNAVWTPHDEATGGPYGMGYWDKTSVNLQHPKTGILANGIAYSTWAAAAADKMLTYVASGPSHRFYALYDLVDDDYTQSIGGGSCASTVAYALKTTTVSGYSYPNPVPLDATISAATMRSLAGNTYIQLYNIAIGLLDSCIVLDNGQNTCSRTGGERMKIAQTLADQVVGCIMNKPRQLLGRYYGCGVLSGYSGTTTATDGWGSSTAAPGKNIWGAKTRVPVTITDMKARTGATNLWEDSAATGLGIMIGPTNVGWVEPYWLVTESYCDYTKDDDGDNQGSSASGLIVYSPPLGTNCATPSNIPAGYSPSGGDCNDGDAKIHTYALEVCGNSVDENCNGSLTDGCCTFYQDADNDGYGTPNTTLSFRCDGAVDGYKSRAGDCDDATVGRGIFSNEVCSNGVDEDCDGVDPACICCGGNCNVSPSVGVCAPNYVLGFLNQCSFNHTVGVGYACGGGQTCPAKRAGGYACNSGCECQGGVCSNGVCACGVTCCTGKANGTYCKQSSGADGECWNGKCSML